MPRSSPYRAFSVGATAIVTGGTSKSIVLVNEESNQTDRRMLKVKTLRASISINNLGGQTFLGWVAFYRVPRGVDVDTQNALNFPYFFKRTPVALSGGPNTNGQAWANVYLEMEGLNASGNEEIGVIINNAYAGSTNVPSVSVSILGYAMETS